MNPCIFGITITRERFKYIYVATPDFGQILCKKYLNIRYKTLQKKISI